MADRTGTGLGKKLVALVLGLWMAAGADPASAAETIKVGFMAPFSGIFAQAGKDMLEGLKLAFEQIGYQTAGRKIDVPTMFLAGERDPVLSFVPVDEMRNQVSDLREFVLVPGAGHWIQQERPAETNEALLRFLAGLSPPS